MGSYIPRYDIDEELLKELREKGLTYQEISDHIERTKGIKISVSTICKRMKSIMPKETNQTKNEVSEEQLKALREQGLTYREISEYLNSIGIEISLGLARTRIMQIYAKEGKKEPKANIKYKKSPELEQITDEELQELRKSGLSTGKIHRYYTEKGIKVSRQWIWIRLKRIEEKQAAEVPQTTRKITKSEIIDKILELRETKKATPMQMRKLAKLYRVEVEFEDTLNRENGEEQEDIEI